MGLPLLVVAPQGEASETVTGHGAGLWVPPDDPQSFAQAALRLADDSDLRRSLAAASLGAAPLHTRRRQAEEMLQVLEVVVAGRGCRASDALHQNCTTGEPK